MVQQCEFLVHNYKKCHEEFSFEIDRGHRGGAVFTLSACTKWTERSLVGTYGLNHPTGCRDDIQDSTLVVRADGRYDQHVHLKSGGDESVENGYWTYDRATRRINFSKFLVSSETSFSTLASHPNVIFVNRSGDCWYQHPK
jgi:hypothetical protein